MYATVQLLAEGEEEDMQELARAPPPRGPDGEDAMKAWSADQLYEAIEPYWQVHSQIIVSHEARSPDLFSLEDGGGSSGEGNEEEERGEGDGSTSGDSGFWKVTQKIMVGNASVGNVLSVVYLATLTLTLTRSPTWRWSTSR